ncbi:hypothetical protein CASFOL_004065 [Castilleja foliolosa]|uniref:Uncharacterized protein n=1 Tax=Castilleja foliolosa TaxID=1961234 RepID=A0ABD3EMH1_9LAMI
MDFHLPQELYATSDYVFDEFEHEDDIFYRELRERVLQLTIEDDGDDVEDEEIFENKNSTKQGLNNNKCVQQNRGYYNWPVNRDEDKSAPTWISNLWKNGTGTGVFIPQIVPSGRKNRTRKRKGRKGRKSKKVEENKDLN